MVIEPFNYQKRTNIEEHNQIVDKLNEVVDAVNNIDPNPSEFEQRIDALELSAINQQNAIEGIHTRDALQDTAIQRAEDNVSQLERNVAGVNENVSGLTGRVGQLETDTTNLDGRVTDLNGRLTTLAGNQTALEGRVDSINTEVGQLSTEVGGLETGKVDKDQGVANAGKYLKVSNEGTIVYEANGLYGGEWKLLTTVVYTGGTVTSPENITFVEGEPVYIPPTASYLLVGRLRPQADPDFEMMGRASNAPSVMPLRAEVDKWSANADGNIPLRISVGMEYATANDRYVDIYYKDLNMGSLYIGFGESYAMKAQKLYINFYSAFTIDSLDTDVEGSFNTPSTSWDATKRLATVTIRFTQTSLGSSIPNAYELYPYIFTASNIEVHLHDSTGNELESHIRRFSMFGSNYTDGTANSIELMATLYIPSGTPDFSQKITMRALLFQIANCEINYPNY